MRKSDIKIGYELEAGLKWKSVNCYDECISDRSAKQRARRLGFRVGGDGSVNCKNAEEVEFRSPVYSASDEEKIYSDFKKISNPISEINSSMGLHFHISFPKTKYYQYLFSYEFVKLFQDAYAKYFTDEVEQRRVQNCYCKFYKGLSDFNNEFMDAIHSKYKCDARHHSVNFNSYPVHHTIEFRIFPSTKDVEKFKRYLTFLIGIIENYINGCEAIRIKCGVK